MLSSTITELADMRRNVRELVDEAGLATAWLFEEHASAAGSTPNEQYLGIARTCDLYVLIVANQHSPATEAEYEAAYEDNPEKVLPFFLGDGTPDVAHFRNLIERRHTRVVRYDLDELAHVISHAIENAVQTGSLGKSISHPRARYADRPGKDCHRGRYGDPGPPPFSRQRRSDGIGIDQGWPSSCRRRHRWIWQVDDRPDLGAEECTRSRHPADLRQRLGCRARSNGNHPATTRGGSLPRLF